ncbi:hypothetical protein ABPG75_007319 [Micractinium tetrahymenae]
MANCATVITKSCECMRRCQEYFCRRTSDGNELCQGVELGYKLKDLNDRGCYERKGVPPDEQYSTIPEPDEQNVQCWSGHKPDAAPINCTQALYLSGGDGTNAPMSLCPNGCNSRGYCVRPKGQEEGRGKCIDQFCHCEPPYFSTGCTRSKVYPANYSQPSAVDFKIYMYELDTQHSFMDPFLDSTARTEDPSEANLFFLPGHVYSYADECNVGPLNGHMLLLLDHIKMNYPYWNRSRGRDHFVWVPGDIGACELTGLGLDLIRIVHFGYHTTPSHYGPMGHLGPEYGCFHPLRDVVATPHDGHTDVCLEAMENVSLEELLKGKTRLFFFAGGVLPEHPTYSGLTRQMLKNLTVEWQDPEFDFVESVGKGVAYQRMLSSSKFCLAPFGYGWGNRLVQAMLSGCVPEHVFQPFEDVLAYETFSIRLTNSDLPRLREILRSVTSEQYHRLLGNVLRHRGAFAWDADKGGSAFEYMLLSLQRRYMNLKALHF